MDDFQGHPTKNIQGKIAIIFHYEQASLIFDGNLFFPKTIVFEAVCSIFDSDDNISSII
jgi:hypothetical protein